MSEDSNIVEQEVVPEKPGHLRHWLKEPVVITLTPSGGEPRTERIRFVDMRMKVKGKDMRATDAFTGPITKQMGLIARLCGVPMLVIDEMDQEDVTALMELTDENPTIDGSQAATGDGTGDGATTGSAPSA